MVPNCGLCARCLSCWWRQNAQHLGVLYLQQTLVAKSRVPCACSRTRWPALTRARVWAPRYGMPAPGSFV